MSKYVVCEVHCVDEQSIVAAIEEMGFSKGLVKTGQKVSIPADVARSYDARIVIPAGTAGTKHPIAFVKQSDGKYMLVMSSDDRFSAAGKRFLSMDRSGTGEFVRAYAKHRIIKAVKSNFGHKVLSCEKEGERIRIRVAV